jgi:cardiolipin synthase
LSAGESGQRRSGGVGDRLRAGLRRHGVIPRPAAVRQLLAQGGIRFTQGNVIELFQDGHAGLSAMLDAIASARRRIHLETYILRGDETGVRFMNALAERARNRVEVRLLYDAVGSLGLDTDALAELRAAGGDAVAFNPLSRLYPRWAPRRRDHRKILVVDGQVAFTGGLNVGDEYFHGTRVRGDGRSPWRDAHLRVQGPAAHVLDAVFLESWFRADGPGSPWPVEAEPAALEPGDETVGVMPDGPTYHHRRMRDLLVGALAHVQHRARIVTPYFLPGPKLRAALGAAAARGVRVEILIAGVIDHPFVRWAGHALLPELVDRGVHVFEYERAMMHAKAAVFDENLAVIGTSNLDRQSLQHSYEVNLVVQGTGLPASLSNMLERDISEARVLTIADLGRRFSLRRLRARLAAFVLGRV